MRGFLRWLRVGWLEGLQRALVRLTEEDDAPSSGARRPRGARRAPGTRRRDR